MYPVAALSRIDYGEVFCCVVLMTEIVGRIFDLRAWYCSPDTTAK
jgi:hypothetical protein